jgi:hypothetical protein
MIFIMKGNFWYNLLLPALFALPAITAQAQYSIIPLAISPVYLKSQLWNATISNTGISAEGKIQINMTDLQTHQSVLSAATGSFRIPTGASMMQMSSLEPITYSYNSPVVVDRSPNGTLPVGQYQVCYELLVTYGENQTVAAEDCEEIAVEPLSPPLLTSPEDDSVLTSLLPNFTWMPPTPLSMFSDLTYNVILSEVADGQSLTDAIQKNLPLQQAQELQQPFLSYPLTGPQLEDGKTYAWQVVAMNGPQYAAKSEVWSFKTPAKKDSAGNNTSMYILMDGHTSGIGASDSSMLRVKYVSFLTAYQAPVQIKDLSGNLLLTTQVQIKQGDNYLAIPLNGNFERKKNYTAVFQDRTGKLTSVTFTIK